MIEQRLGLERLCEKIDKNNEQVEKSHQRSASNMAECLAEDLYKPLKCIEEGRDSYFPSFGYGKKYASNYDKINWSH